MFCLNKNRVWNKSEQIQPVVVRKRHKRTRMEFFVRTTTATKVVLTVKMQMVWGMTSRVPMKSIHKQTASICATTIHRPFYSFCFSVLFSKMCLLLGIFVAAKQISIVQRFYILNRRDHTRNALGNIWMLRQSVVNRLAVEWMKSVNGTKIDCFIRSHGDFNCRIPTDSGLWANNVCTLDLLLFRTSRSPQLMNKLEIVRAKQRTFMCVRARETERNLKRSIENGATTTTE